MLPNCFLNTQVWVVFIGGAASLFIATVLVENNGAWFPAIARANQFLANSKKQVGWSAGVLCYAVCCCWVVLWLWVALGSASRMQVC
jgi:hypothetical protein